MKIYSRRSAVVLAGSGALLASAGLLVQTVRAATSSPRVATNGRGVALDGYDTTAYWRTGAAREGTSTQTEQWHGAPWYFADAAAAQMFSTNPEAVAPQFGGFCTRAMSFGKTVNGDPNVWRIYRDKLYLFALPVGGEKFDEGQDAMITLAQQFWDTPD
jgi:hypothetical protein